MRSEKGLSDQKLVFPEELMSVIINGEFNPMTESEEWFEAISEKILELLKKTQTFEEFQKVLGFITEGVLKAVHLGLVIFPEGVSLEESCGPIYKKILLKMVKKDYFNKE